MAYDEKDNNLTSISITGGNAFTLGGVHTDTGAATTLSANTASSLTSINASTDTGGVLIAAGATDTLNGFSLTYTGLSITGGSGIDFIINSAASGVVTLGNGGTALGSTATETQAEVTNTGETVNVGTGFDLVTVTNTSYTGTAGTVAETETISGAATANHTAINLHAFSTTSTVVDYTTLAAVTGAPSLAAAEGNVANAEGANLGYFTYNGNEYIVAGGHYSGASINNYNTIGTDVVVTLTGGNFHAITDASGTLTLA